MSQPEPEPQEALPEGIPREAEAEAENPRPDGGDSDGPDSGGVQAQFIESVLALLFLQKFDQYEQMQNALKNHLRTPAGRASLAAVLMARQQQWGQISNRTVSSNLVGMVTLAFDALESGAAMDRVTGDPRAACGQGHAHLACRGNGCVSTPPPAWLQGLACDS